MTTHAVVIPNKIAAMENAAWVRPVICASNVDNGNIFQLLTKSSTTGEGEVWLATAPTTASSTDVWMALEPEKPFVTTAGGEKVYGIGTIQDFYNTASLVFTGVKLQKGDVITVTADALDSATTQAYAVPSTGIFEYVWAPAASSGFSLKYLGAKYIPYADGTIGSQVLTGYQFEVVGV